MLCLLKEAAPWLCALAAISTAQAADYPDHPVHVIVATSPGGTSDIFIRAMSDEFQKRAGQPIIVDTRSGGQMNIGGRACAEASGDGYTICFLPNETLVLNEFLFKNLSFNPAVDFRPITNPFFNVQVVVAGASLGVRSMAELATKSKERPATLGYSALSLPLQLFMEEWKAKTGADIVNVPMRGGGDAVTGVMTGTAPVAIVGIPNWLPYIRTGQANALAVNSQERSPLLPDAPTLKELGYPDESQMFFGLVAPPKTPDAIVEKLYGWFKSIGDDPDFRRRRLIEQGLVPVFDTPSDFGDFMKSERVASKRRIEAAGLEMR